MRMRAGMGDLESSAISGGWTAVAIMSSLLLSGLLLIIPLSLAASYQYDILVILPDDPTCYGTNGEAMLTAVQFATERLHVMQLPFTLNIRNLVTGCSSRTSSPVQLTRELTKTTNDSLTIGYFCEGTLLDLELIGIAHPDRLGLVEISVNTFLPVVSEARLRPLYYQTFPSSLYYTEALAQFMDSVGWNKIGIAYTELINSYHFQVSQQVLQGLLDKGLGPIKMFKVTDSAHTKTSHDITQTVKEIHVSGIYVLLSPTDTTLLLCTAYEYGLRWPDYASDISSWDFEILMLLKVSCHFRLYLMVATHSVVILTCILMYWTQTYMQELSTIPSWPPPFH